MEVMASPPPTGRKIVKFNAGSLNPDMRLKVFTTTEYHVHSAILKIHSGFFRKFLDSPDKFVPASAEFTYEWVTKIDDDGSWHLIAIQSQRAEDAKKTLPLELDQSLEEKAFNNIMCALYIRPYTINEAEEVVRMAELADYYRVLRVVSHSLNEPMRDHVPLGFAVMDDPDKFIKIGVKLRNYLLFKDSFIMRLGPWVDQATDRCEWESARFAKLAERVHNRIGGSIAFIHSCLLAEIKRNKGNNETMKRCLADYAESGLLQGVGGLLSLPRYYQAIYDTQSPDGSSLFESDLEPLMSNRLELIKWIKAGEGAYKDWFLCGKIEDDELPWDIEEEDW